MEINCLCLSEAAGVWIPQSLLDTVLQTLVLDVPLGPGTYGKYFRHHMDINHVRQCWEICNVQRINGDGQTNGRRVQNREEEDAETKGGGRRVELSLLVFNLGVQCYILSMDDSMSIQH